jgi:hypothetical protein
MEKIDFSMTNIVYTVLVIKYSNTAYILRVLYIII